MNLQVKKVRGGGGGGGGGGGVAKEDVANVKLQVKKVMGRWAVAKEVSPT